MNASQSKRKRFKLDTLILLAGFAALMLLALWIGVFFQLHAEKKIIQQHAQGRGQVIARTFAEHCNYVLRQADHAAHLFQSLHNNSNGNLTLNEFVQKELRDAFGNDLVSQLYLIDTDGNMLESSSPAADPRSRRQTNFFKEHASRASLMARVGTPVVDGDNTWMIQMSRRLQKKDGSFAGVILVEIDPIYLVDQYDYSDLGLQGSLILRNVSNNMAVHRIGHNVTRSEKMQVHITQLGLNREGGMDEQVTVEQQFDKLARLYNVRDLPEYNVQAVVGLPLADITTRFAVYQKMYFGYAVAVSLLIIIGTGILTWQTQRSRRNMRAARAAEAILSSAAEGSLDAFYILRCDRDEDDNILDFTVTHINERGAKLLGISALDLRGKRLCATLPGFRNGGYFQTYVQVAESGTPLEEEYEIDIPQIKARWLHHQIVSTGNGVAITVRDITARKNAELETRKNRNFLKSLIDYLPVLVSVTASTHATSGNGNSGSGKIMIWNRAASSFTGIAQQDVLGKKPHEVFDEAATRAILAREQRLIDDNLLEYRAEEIMKRFDGSIGKMQTVSVPLRNDAGEVEYILCIAEDITLRREHELQIRKSQAELAALNDASPLGLVGADRTGQCRYVNRTFEVIAGISREQALGDGWVQAIYEDDRKKIAQGLEFLMKNTGSYQDIYRLIHPNGRLVWASVKIAAIWIDGKIEGFVGSVDDITQRREAELALRESEARLRTITNTIPAMVAYIDANEVYRFHNKAYEREIGISMLDTNGKTVRQVVGEARYAVIAPYIRRVLAGETVTYEDNVSHGDQFRMMQATYIPQFADDGTSVIGFHVMRHDITATKLEEQRLVHLAQLDVLTGLSNRAGFMQKLRDAMHHCRQHGGLIALMYMDIDYFKAVNDTHGHHVGDLLLSNFAQRLCQSLRAVDNVARLGGDEFTVIMEHLSRADDAHAVAEKVVQVMRQSFVLEGVEVCISTSIGLAFFAGSDISAEALMNKADMMLYQAKHGGRNTWRAAPVESPTSA